MRYGGELPVFSPYTSTPPLPVKPPYLHLMAEGFIVVRKMSRLRIYTAHSIDNFYFNLEESLLGSANPAECISG